MSNTFCAEETPPSDFFLFAASFKICPWRPLTDSLNSNHLISIVQKPRSACLAISVLTTFGVHQTMRAVVRTSEAPEHSLYLYLAFIAMGIQLIMLGTPFKIAPYLCP